MSAVSGAHRPVGALVLLVELDAEVALEQRRQPEGLDAEQLRGHARVEDVATLPAVVLVQQPQVVVGVVEDDLDVGSRQRAPARQRPGGERDR
jgi:hypothetical protein